MDLELFGGFFGAGFLGEFDATAFDGEVEVVGAGTGVAAGFGACAGGHVCDAEVGHGVAERSGFAGGEDDADLGKGDAEGGDEAEEVGIWEVASGIWLVLVVSGVGSHAREGDGELCFPAVFVEVFEVGAEGEGLVVPVGEAEECADADAPEAAGVGALGAIEAPVKVFFGAGGVEGLVGFAVVGFLIDDEAFGSVLDEFGVLVVFHGSDFEGECGEDGE